MQNEFFFAKTGFDTAQNGPSKVRITNHPIRQVNIYGHSNRVADTTFEVQRGQFRVALQRQAQRQGHPVAYAVEEGQRGQRRVIRAKTLKIFRRPSAMVDHTLSFCTAPNEATEPKSYITLVWEST